MKTSEIFIRSLEIRDYLQAHHNCTDNSIDTSLLPVLPFRISDDIKLIIIGQDPTVKNPKSRSTIQYSLNLDLKGSLKRYIQQICQSLGIGFENIYATNVFKYFYTEPPERTMSVLHNHLPENLELLLAEISSYPKSPVIILGLPVLQLLAGEHAQVSYFWDYNKTTKQTNGNFKYCAANTNKLHKDFYPLPHQPSLQKDFYNNTISQYLQFIKNKHYGHSNKK